MLTHYSYSIHVKIHTHKQTNNSLIILMPIYTVYGGDNFKV